MSHAPSNDRPTTPTPAAPSPAAGVSTTAALSSLVANAPATAVRRPARLATSIESAGSSGVIDLDALRDGTAAPGAVTGLASNRLIADPSPPASEGPSPGLLYGTVGLLGGVVAVLGVLALQTPTTVVIERQTEPAGTLAVSEARTTPTEGDATRTAPRKKKIAMAARAPATETPEPVEVTDTSTDAPSAASTAAKTSKRPASATKSRSTKSRSTKPAASKKTASAANVPIAKPATPKATQPKPAAKARPGDTSVACILDPASCESPSTVTKPAAPKPKTPTSSLPEKLSISALRSGLAGPKSAAKVCGSMHAIPAGTKVDVKLSIAGATGKVTKATPLAPFANSAGRCVADKLADATFEPFSKVAMGVVYGVRM